MPTKKATAPKKTTKARKRPVPMIKKPPPRPSTTAKRRGRGSASKPQLASAAPAENLPARLPRHAIFIDVENTSSETALFEAIDSLRIDRQAYQVEMIAIGNWRSVGPAVGRRLASMGSQLVHSAPARGVRDWSDLWIAVAAGCWLGQAALGDILDIISNDRAFDAVGDIAAARGIAYRRQHHKPPAASDSDESKPPRRARGGRRRRRVAAPEGTLAAHKPEVAVRPPTVTTPHRPSHIVEPPHGASRDQIIMLIRRLTHEEHGRWVNIDILEKALKSEGFARPPGSPRLVTRLRMLKDVEVDANGRVRLVTSPEHATH